MFTFAMEGLKQNPGMAAKGRGTPINPRNRFESTEILLDEEEHAHITTVRTRYYRDFTQAIVTKNDSPDVGFSKSINPYRGCEHGCVYCYARPTHAYLGFSAGLDFETRIMVKEDAPRLLEKHLGSPRWKPEPIGMSGVTDPYQPIERKFKITRQCLEVFAKFRNPVFVITKNNLITRDLDVLSQLNEFQCICVMISLTSLDPKLARSMEPRTASPRQRLETIKKLNRLSIPVGINIAPVIPGLNDEEIPAILKAATTAGAQFASYGMIRLPYEVKDIFVRWLEDNFPSRAEKVIDRIRKTRGGELNRSEFGERMKGSGVWAEQTRNLFELGLRSANLKMSRPHLSTKQFRRDEGSQMLLF